MSKPIRWTDYLVTALCQVTVEKWNTIVKWVRRQEIIGFRINGYDGKIQSTQDGTLLELNIPVGGLGATRCTALVASVGDDGTGTIQACISPGIISVPPDVQDTGPGGVALPDVAPGGTPVYGTNNIPLTVNGATFDAVGTPICISPFDPTTECLLLKLEFRGGDPTASPTTNPDLVVPPGEIVALNIEKAPITPKPAEQACREAEYDPGGVQTTTEQNGILYWPLWDNRLTNPQAMCGNMQLYYCGGCSWQLFSLPGNTPS